MSVAMTHRAVSDHPDHRRRTSTRPGGHGASRPDVCTWIRHFNKRGFETRKEVFQAVGEATYWNWPWRSFVWGRRRHRPRRRPGGAAVPGVRRLAGRTD